MPTFLVDGQGALLFSNAPAETLLGRRFDEAGEMKLDVWSTIFRVTDENGASLPQGVAAVRGPAGPRPAYRIIWFRASPRPPSQFLMY